MGHGMILKCDCQEHFINLGIGMAYPRVFKEDLEDARSGRLGEDIQKATQGKQYLAIDAENCFYYCSQCGYWEVTGSHDLYEPKNLELMKLRQFGIKTVEEWGEIPYARGSDFEEYNLIFKYPHICPKCNIEMVNPKTIGKRVLSKIRCQECGSLLREDNERFVLWD